MNNFAETFFNILFRPVETFQNFSTEKPYKLPFAIVVIASCFLSVLFSREGQFNPLVIFSYVFDSIGLVIYWLYFAFFVDLMAKTFTLQSNYAKLLTLTSLSYIPWIFLAPLKLLKNVCSLTAEIAIILIFGVWIWTITLQILAISETYSIPRKNAILILLLPFLGCILYLTWVIDFFVKLAQFANL